MSVLSEISEKWKLEAKQEDNMRYFFHVKEAAKVLSGEKFYVVGRKGSGKSAISQYILNLCNENAATGYKFLQSNYRSRTSLSMSCMPYKTGNTLSQTSISRFGSILFIHVYVA